MHTRDFTKGNLYLELAQLSIPLIFGNILQQLYNMMDAFVIGRFAGKEEFAAIGIAGTVMNLFLFMIVGACTGLSILFARYYGEKDEEKLKKQHFTALTVGLLFSVVLAVLGWISLKNILQLIHTPAELTQYTIDYLRWILLSLPAAFLYNMYAAALRSAGDTMAALEILAVAVISNFVLDLLFVAKLHLGIRGAAQATACTQGISAVLCLCYLYHSHKEFLFGRKQCRIEKSWVLATIQCSLVTAVHQAGLYIGKMLVQGVVNTAGTEVISGYTAATRIEGFANSFGDSGSAATSVLVSQNYGAGSRERVHKTFRCSMKLTLSLGILCAILLFFSAPLTIRWLTAEQDGIAVTSGVYYLEVIACFYVFCFTGGTFTGFFNGLGKVKITLAGTLFQITLRVLLSWMLFTRLQLPAVAVATGIGWFLANIFWGVIRYRFLSDQYLPERSESESAVK